MNEINFKFYRVLNDMRSINYFLYIKNSYDCYTLFTISQQYNFDNKIKNSVQSQIPFVIVLIHTLITFKNIIFK